jgi:hypothetical protein
MNRLSKPVERKHIDLASLIKFHHYQLFVETSAASGLSIKIDKTRQIDFMASSPYTGLIPCKSQSPENIAMLDRPTTGRT